MNRVKLCSSFKAILHLERPGRSTFLCIHLCADTSMSIPFWETLASSFFLVWSSSLAYFYLSSLDSTCDTCAYCSSVYIIPTRICFASFRQAVTTEPWSRIRGTSTKLPCDERSEKNPMVVVGLVETTAPRRPAQKQSSARSEGHLFLALAT